MTRQLITAACLVAALSFAASTMAQTTRTTHDEVRIYVIVEVTGMEVSCTQFQSQQEVNTHVADLQRENAERAKANRTIAEDVKKLTAQLTAKKHALAGAKDDAAKEGIQKEIDDLTTQIDQKKAEVKTLTTWQPPKRFNKREDADKFIAGVYKQAEAEKERAAKKEEEARKKAEEKNN